MPVRKQYQAQRVLMYAGMAAVAGSLITMIMSSPSAGALAVALAGMLASVPFLVIQKGLEVREKWSSHPDAQSLIAEHRALVSELSKIKSGSIVESLQRQLHAAHDEITQYKRIYDDRNDLLGHVRNLENIIAQQTAKANELQIYLEAARQGQTIRIINETQRPTRDRNGNPVF